MPEDSDTEPAAPDEAPVLMTTLPEFPSVAAPDMTVTSPLMPLSELLTLTLPLMPAVPAPLVGQGCKANYIFT